MTFHELSPFNYIHTVCLKVGELLTPSACVSVSMMIVGNDWLPIIGAYLLVFVDTALGVTASYVQKEKITSTKFKRVIPKMVAVGSLIITGNIVSALYAEIGGLILYAITAYIITNEGMSIIENGQKILGGDTKKIIEKLNIIKK